MVFHIDYPKGKVLKGGKLEFSEGVRDQPEKTSSGKLIGNVMQHNISACPVHILHICELITQVPALDF